MTRALWVCLSSSISERFMEIRELPPIWGNISGNKLLRLGAFPEEDYHETKNLYSRIMEIRFRAQVKAFHENRVPQNLVHREELTQIEQAIISKAFSELASYQEKIFEDFKNQ